MRLNDNIGFHWGLVTYFEYILVKYCLIIYHKLRTVCLRLGKRPPIGKININKLRIRLALTRRCFIRFEAFEVLFEAVCCFI